MTRYCSGCGAPGRRIDNCPICRAARDRAAERAGWADPWSLTIVRGPEVLDAGTYPSFEHAQSAANGLELARGASGQPCHAPLIWIPPDWTYAGHTSIAGDTVYLIEAAWRRPHMYRPRGRADLTDLAAV